MWPRVSFAAVPPLREAQALATAVRTAVLGSREAIASVDLEPLCLLGGFRMKVAQLASRAGGHESLLIPLPQGGFEILVDPATRE